ncbi:unnamed protein product [Ambrosiozyma monospora]|uniref:Unnamed protein product n=1 Tax=Ambrosiozyma monospora TaxID=43982 RepID=A0ACB5UAQ6_AMBMO|nr:unnamed protein product [Ambrosiozyma monospora]
MVVGINTSIAFFIADISNVWVSELSEVFNLTCYLISNIITWEWLNRMAQLERHEQKGGVLGRQFFYDVDDDKDKTPEKLNQVNSNHSNHLRPSQTHLHHHHHHHENSNTRNRSNSSNNRKQSKGARKIAQQFNLKLENYDKIKTELQQYRNRFMGYNYNRLKPRSSSTHPDHHHHGRSSSSITSSSPTTNEVYIYSPKQISIDAPPPLFVKPPPPTPTPALTLTPIPNPMTTSKEY